MVVSTEITYYLEPLFAALFVRELRDEVFSHVTSSLFVIFSSVM